ncbi:diacylglycerol kinase variant A [Cryptosporidium ryanae]|uniref:diacylglycerol kinase variant A n=1 Tax=Cryptosporidium ryanae TaxID=515981 RepID=UPI00351A5EE1|nr:diacylglycerol kinase variant A [Cryptosporidium ryanae]
MSQKEELKEDFFRAETLDSLILSNNLNEEEEKICKHCKINELQLSVFREYIGDPLAFIFLFYNKLSGGNIESYFSSKLKEIVLDVDGITTHISFIDMISEIDVGIKHVKNSLKLTSKDICIIGIGGDGSFSNLVHLFLEKIPNSEERLVFAVLPFGTGNDWAKNFGWSSYGNIKFMKDDFTPLIDLARGIFTSKIINFDIWAIEVELKDKEDSCFLKVNPLTQELQKIESYEKNNEITQNYSELTSLENIKKNDKLLKLKKRCLNYFSFGEESRVGITFDTYRKKNVLINRALYGLAGSVFSVNLKNKQQNIPLSHSTKGVYLIDNVNNTQKNDFICALCPNGVKHTMGDLDRKENLGICPTLSNSVSLVFLNIETFGGGVHLWRNSKNVGHSISSDDTKANINLGEMVGTISSLLTNQITLQSEQVDTKTTDTGVNSSNDAFTKDEKPKDLEIFSSETTNEEPSFESVIKEKIMNIVPSSCDRKMEIMSFSGLLDISSIFLPYMNAARKVGQFSPFETDREKKVDEKKSSLSEEKNLVIIFKKSQENTPDDNNLIEMYFQIDGEYYLAKEPKHCILRYDRTIRVLNCIVPYSPFVLK